MSEEPQDPQAVNMWTVMAEGYDRWRLSTPVAGLLAHIHKLYPNATPLELHNHVLHYTLVKLVVWLQPPTDGEKKEPWQ